MKMYCGNNLSFQGILNGTHYLGTKNKCLKRGVGVGKNLPFDENYNNEYEPVDNRKYYCGNKEITPPNYFAEGSPSICHRIGVGVGKAIRSQEPPPNFMYFNRYILPYLLFGLGCLIIFLILYNSKPNFVSKNDEIKKEIIIDWSKFIPYFILFSLIFGLFFKFFWYKVIRKYI